MTRVLPSPPHTINENIRQHSSPVRLDVDGGTSDKTPKTVPLGDGEYLVVWRTGESTDNTPAPIEVRAQEMSADGTPDGDPFSVATIDEFEDGENLPGEVAVEDFQAVQVGENRVAVSWREITTGLVGDEETPDTVKTRVVSGDGEPVSPVIDLGDDANASHDNPRVLSLGSDRFVAAWHVTKSSVSNVHAKVFEADGEAITDTLNVSAETAKPGNAEGMRITSPSVSLAETPDGFAVTYVSPGSVKTQIYERAADPQSQYRADGPPVSLSAEDVAPRPEVALVDDERLAVSYNTNDEEDTYATNLNLATIDLASPTEPAVSLVSDAAWYSQLHALPNGDVLTTWRGLAPENSEHGLNLDIFGRILTAEGEPNSESFLVNTARRGNQGLSGPEDEFVESYDIEPLPDGGFAATWHGDLGTDIGEPVRAQAFDNQGASLGGEFLVNEENANGGAPDTAALGDRRFAVSWESNDRQGGPGAITTQVFEITDGAENSVPLLEYPTGYVVSALYVGYFGRPPTVSGQNYWTEAIEADDNERKPLTAETVQAADSFSQSQEARDKYDALSVSADRLDDRDVETFVTDVFQNLFNRRPSDDGATYWTDRIASALNDDDADIGRAVLDIMLGARGQDAETLQNKIYIADLYGERVYETQFAEDQAVELIGNVDHTENSLDAAVVAMPPN